MQKMQRSMLLFTFLAIFLLEETNSTCLLNQPYITLGDTYAGNGREVDHLITIGIVKTGECGGKDPYLLLDSKQRVELSEKNAYSFQSGFPRFTYIRTAYFWYINKQDVTTYKTWQIKIDGGVFDTLGPFDFPTRILNKENSGSIGIIADMDLTEVGMPTLDELVTLSRLDLFIHNGDMAYDIVDDQGNKGDLFFDAMKPVITKAFYAPIAGNHERRDFTELLNYRFRLPTIVDGKKQKFTNRRYSFTYKGVHLMFMDFDYIFYYKPDPEEFQEAFDWLENDLKGSQSANWRIFFSHRPFYCSDVEDSHDCTRNFYYMRKFEALLNKYKVQLIVSAHIHAYMRTKVFDSWEFKPYPKDNKPGVPIQILEGHSGTSHYFATPTDDPRFELPFIETANDQFASWIEVKFTEDNLEVIAWNSGKNTMADHFFIAADKSGDGSPILNSASLRLWAGASLSLVILLIGLFGIYKKNRAMAKKGDSKQKRLIDFASIQISTKNPQESSDDEA